MEWRFIVRTVQQTTKAGIVYPEEAPGWQCMTPTCGAIRWGATQPDDQCEICCPPR